MVLPMTCISFTFAKSFNVQFYKNISLVNMKNIAIIYGSSSGNTKNVASKIAQKLSGENVLLKDVADVNFADLANYPNIILGVSTWGIGDFQEDWAGRVAELKNIDLTGKTLAFFGLGDSSSFSDTFNDGMGILYEAVEGKGFKLAGEFSTCGYSFDASRAEKGGSFVGLALDEDNESNLTNQRLDAWLADVIPQLQ
ncbi:MAG: flavodoxin [Prevotellaceae bacterium]|jgi:flavodoxin I|nr:flavodoxin [Prevotellaceae bacterium]